MIHHVGLWWLACIAGPVFALVLADDIRLRRLRHQRALEDAARAADALSDYVRVAGVDLPLPDDPRWRRSKVQLLYQNPAYTQIVDLIEGEFPGFSLGPVTVTGRDAWGFDCVIVNATLLEKKASAENKKYAESVYATQTTRSIREALIKGE